MSPYSNKMGGGQQIARFSCRFFCVAFCVPPSTVPVSPTGVPYDLLLGRWTKVTGNGLSASLALSDDTVHVLL